MGGLGFYAYDYTSGESGKVIDENISDYSIDAQNNMIYYFVKGEGLYKMNMSTKEKSKIFESTEESGSCQVSYDGKYLYINNIFWCFNQSAIKKIQGNCWVVDTNGGLINTIPCDKFLGIFFGDEKFLLGRKINDVEPNSMAFIDKKNIENAKEWNWCYVH